MNYLRLVFALCDEVQTFLKKTLSLSVMIPFWIPTYWDYLYIFWSSKIICGDEFEFCITMDFVNKASLCTIGGEFIPVFRRLLFSTEVYI